MRRLAKQAAKRESAACFFSDLKKGIRHVRTPSSGAPERVLLIQEPFQVWSGEAPRTLRE
jgi:hypothetical protein